jgi:hypothetical protein
MITARDLRAHFGRKPVAKPANRIHFASAGLVPPQFRNRAAPETTQDATKKQNGWERQFWDLLSPATADLLRAELTRKSED